MKYIREINRIVRGKWESTGREGKILLALFVVFVLVLLLILAFIWLLGRIVKGLSVGGTRNLDLYFPKARGSKK